MSIPSVLFLMVGPDTALLTADAECGSIYCFGRRNEYDLMETVNSILNKPQLTLSLKKTGKTRRPRPPFSTHINPSNPTCCHKSTPLPRVAIAAAVARSPSTT